MSEEIRKKVKALFNKYDTIISSVEYELASYHLTLWADCIIEASDVVDEMKGLEDG